jgi:GxxExxY protein
MGACFEVYKEKGCGFAEAVYQECLDIEFEHQQIPYIAQRPIKLYYKDRELSQFYIPDFYCFQSIVLEIKAVSELSDEHRAQVINYLKAANAKLGLLVNFGHYPKIQWERIAYSQKI